MRAAPRKVRDGMAHYSVTRTPHTRPARRQAASNHGCAPWRTLISWMVSFRSGGPMAGIRRAAVVAALVFAFVGLGRPPAAQGRLADARRPVRPREADQPRERRRPGPAAARSPGSTPATTARPGRSRASADASRTCASTRSPAPRRRSSRPRRSSPPSRRCPASPPTRRRASHGSGPTRSTRRERACSSRWATTSSSGRFGVRPRRPPLDVARQRGGRDLQPRRPPGRVHARRQPLRLARSRDASAR